MRIQKDQAYSRSVRGCILEIEDDSSPTIFVSGGLRDSITFVKNIITEIFGLKRMSFWTNLEPGQPNGDQKTVSIPFGLLIV
jgi:hypothetical protein